MYVLSICVIICITYRKSNTEKEEKKRRDFCAPYDDGDGNQGTIFIFLNKSSPSMSFPSRFFRVYLCVCVRPYSTTVATITMIIYFKSKSCVFFAGYVSNRCTETCNENVRAFKKKEKERMTMR